MATNPTDKYIIVRDGKIEHLLRIANGTARSIASSDKRLALYEALICDTGMSLVQIDVAPTVEVEAASNIGTVAHKGRGADRSGNCGVCGASRVKDGKLRGGKQRWACPNQPHGVGRSSVNSRASQSHRVCSLVFKPLLLVYVSGIDTRKARLVSVIRQLKEFVGDRKGRHPFDTQATLCLQTGLPAGNQELFRA